MTFIRTICSDYSNGSLRNPIVHGFIIKYTECKYIQPLLSMLPVGHNTGSNVDIAGCRVVTLYKVK